MHHLLHKAAAAVVLAVVSAALLLTACVMTHRNAMVVTHGISMNPVYYQGDLVVVQREKSYAVGQIVAYRRPDIHLVVLHRIIGGDEHGWTFKGDNNQSIDPTRPTQDQLIGRAVLHISHGGSWLHRLTAPPLLAAYAFLLLMGGTAATRTRRQRRKDLRTVPPRHRAKPCNRLSSLPPALCPVAAGAAAVGVAGLALSGLAWSLPTHHVVAAAGSATSSMRFSYTAHVPRSAAYDGTTVTAPQPVFRKLASRVDVSYAYTGLPGALAVTVELSTANGWKTTLPFGQTTVGRTYSGTTQLDLASLQRRADAAAKVTGLPAGEVSVTLIPRISLAGGGAFTPRLELGMTDLVLKPAGGLTAKDTAKTTTPRRIAARLSAAGHSIPVASARALGLAALMLFLLAGTVLAAIARLTGPVAEAERIRARYGELILPVLPVAMAPGRPIVDVPDVDSLARLAERYGLLVLTWSRAGIDSYVVQDEGTTYRYRAGVAEASRVLAAAAD